MNNYYNHTQEMALDDWGNEYFHAGEGVGDYGDDDDLAEDYLYEDVDFAFEEDFDDEDDFGLLSDSVPEMAEGLLEVMHESYADASPEEAEQAVYDLLDAMDAAEGFNFGKILKSIAGPVSSVLRNPIVSQIAKTALPIAGGAVGTLIGGPVGTALGSQLGQVAGGAFGGRRRPPRRRRGRRRATRGRPASPTAGSAAAAQLLQLTQNPNMLKSLMSLSLGSQGRQSVRVARGGPRVPVGGFMNLLSSLATRAAADADELAHDDMESSEYLRDSDGEFIVDPSVPEARADALYETLISVENVRLAETEHMY